MSAAGTTGHRDRLPNGVPLAVRYRPGAEVTTVSVWILAGSRHEDRPGAAHLFEHVVMQAVPPGRRDRVVDEIESTGGEANAITTRDHVVLYARVPTGDAALALTILAAAAAAPRFDPDVVAGERRVVQEELRLAAADPTDQVHDVFFAAAFAGHPMGRPVGGTVDGVAGLGAAELAGWAAQSVRPDLLGVVASGGLDPAAVRAALLDGPLATMAGTAGARPAQEVPKLVPARTDRPLVSDTVAVVLGGPAFALDDPRLDAAEVVLELLAGANASVLTEEIRSRRGLSYDISGGVSAYRDTGVWRVAVSTAPEHRDEVVDLATGLLREVARRGFSPAQVALARRRVAGLLRLEVESSLEEALLRGRYALVGGRPGWNLPAHLDRLSTVDVDGVARCLREMLDPLVVATAGGLAD